MNFGNGDPNFRIHIREYTPEDLDACLSIFTSNQDVFPDPPEVLAEFLAAGTSWFLVAELEGKVVACGGLEILGDTNAAHLVHGMVEQSHQRKGIGTLITLTRLLLVPDEEGAPALASMETDVRTEPFYKRFGFERVRPNERRHAGGQMYVDLGLWVNAEQKENIRKILASPAVTFADGILSQP